MKRSISLIGFLALILLIIVACSDSSRVTPEPSPETTNTSPSPSQGVDPSQLETYAPVEDREPNAPYKPAFPGQTRAPGLKTTTPYRVEELFSELRSPWAVTALPDERLIITEKAGQIRIYDPKSRVMSEGITGFPVVDNRSQGGLLDVAPAPDFEASRILYFSFAERTPRGSVTAVGKGTLAEDEGFIKNFTTIYRALPYYDNSMHFGSRLAFDTDGNILLTTGERSDRSIRALAQRLDNGYGKVIHITPDGDPVPRGPFANQAGALDEIYSYGHRNVQGLAFHPVTGDIWISEMGPRGGDELNQIQAGGNYGWGEISYGIEYSGSPINGGETVREGMIQPVYYWDPVLAPSGMAFYTSKAIPEWENNLFIGGLAAQHISRLVLDGDKVAGEERLMEDEGERIRDIGMGQDELYVVTDGGRLYRIGP